MSLARVCAVYAKHHPSALVAGIAQEEVQPLKQAHDLRPVLLPR